MQQKSIVTCTLTGNILFGLTVVMARSSSKAKHPRTRAYYYAESLLQASWRTREVLSADGYAVSPVNEYPFDLFSSKNIPVVVINAERFIEVLDYKKSSDFDTGFFKRISYCSERDNLLLSKVVKNMGASLVRTNGEPIFTGSSEACVTTDTEAVKALNRLRGKSAEEAA